MNQLKKKTQTKRKYQPKEIPPVEYDPKMPIEFFDFIVIDECHRSILQFMETGAGIL